MKQTGQFLKSQREEKNLSISEISMATKINSRILIAIEDGNSSALPSRTFVRGFIVTYCEYLKIDKDEVLKIFNEESKNSVLHVSEIQTNPINPQNTTHFLKASSKWSKILIASVIVLLIGIIIGVNNIVSKYKNEAKNLNPPPQNIDKLLTPPSQTPVASTLSTTSQDKKAENTPSTQKPSPLSQTKEQKKEAPSSQNQKLSQNTTENTSHINSSSQNKVATPSNLEKERPATPPQPKNPTQEAKKETQKEETKKTVEKKEPPKVLPKKPQPQEIIVEALDEVTISYTTASGKKTTLTLEPDQVYTIKSKGPVSFHFEDGGAVNLTRNGKDLGVPGNLGQPLKLTLPKK